MTARPRPIVVGVDASVEGASAATLGWWIAEQELARCQLVHAVRDSIADLVALQVPVDLEPPRRTLLLQERDAIEAALKAAVPDAVLHQLELRFGQPGTVINQVVAEHNAGLIVVGGRHHSVLGRWLGGSTAHHLIHTAKVPVLVTGPSARRITRIVATVDLSEAAAPTLEYAERLAKLTGAELRVMHVVEPIPAPHNPLLMIELRPDPEELASRAAARFDEVVQTLVRDPKATRVIRRGLAAPTVMDEALSWGADLIVAGSHGKGLVDRVLLGSTTRQLLANLVTSVVVVPVTLTERAAAPPATVVAGAGAAEAVGARGHPRGR
jgi:nucleotide-binding universal stress UspA family protein